MKGKRSPETEATLKAVEWMEADLKAYTKKQVIPFGYEERPKPKDPFVVPLKRGR